jgi:VanZ family protein
MNSPLARAAYGSALARLVFAVYLLLVAYASLYPFTGWTNRGVPAFAYVTAALPRYLTAFDLAANIVGYLPFGLLCVVALYPHLRGRAAVGVATASALVLSLTLEAAQGYLPSRIASNVDVLCNLGGALLGAVLGARFSAGMLDGGVLRRWRAGTIQAGIGADVGLVLIGLWLFTQLNPAMLLFGAGDLRDWLAPAGGPAYKPQLFIAIEALTAAANLVAVTLMLSAILAPGRRAAVLTLALVLAAIAVKAAAFAILMHAEHVLVWLTPGAARGLAGGIVAALLAVRLPRSARLVLAAVLLMAATVFVNLAPPNPYLAATITVWRQGHFLNFNGLTRVVSALWPYVALGYLIWLATAQRGTAGKSLWA